ncbi:MAG: PIN domain-containing protein [Beijerinckiaceae bacterium]
MRFLLDTNVISEFGRERPARQVLRFLQAQPLAALFVADVVLAEVRFGVSLLKDEERRQHYAKVLDHEIRPMFQNRILSADEETWLIWKRLESDGRSRRYTFPQPDLVIAALAMEHGLTVVTRDAEPFRQAGAAFVNPWV